MQGRTRDRHETRSTKTGRSGTIRWLALVLLTLLVWSLGSPASAAPAPASPAASPPTPRGARLPLVLKAGADLTISGLEVTQAVQRPDNSVPLVSGRPTMVRIYAQTNSPGSGAGVYASLAGSRNGTPLPGSPLQVGPGSVSATPARGVYTSTFNALLPASWLAGTIDLVATIDSTKQVAETREDNNQATLTANFDTVPALNITLVPIAYTHTPTGQVYPAPTGDPISDWIMRAYPIPAVNITLRAPLAFSGDLKQGADWSRLLNTVTNAKSADGAPASQVYYGLIPISNDSGRWFSGGIAGIGWIGLRASAGLLLSGDTGGRIAAHEIAHNLGRGHAPCGATGGIDPSYPYSGASLGQYGLDISKARVYSPDAPDNSKDLMSYCNPQWVSDYTYSALLNRQRVAGTPQVASQALTDSLLIRARLDAKGVTALQPVYALQAQPSPAPASSAYSVELIGPGGQVVARTPVEADESSRSDQGPDAINALVPRPTEPTARVRLLRVGQIVAERALDSSGSAAAPATLATTADTATVTWDNPDVPALVRFSPDNGRSRTTLGVDVLGGQLALDLSLLPGGSTRFEVSYGDHLGARTMDRMTPAVVTVRDDQAPRAWITGSTRLDPGQPLLVFGHGADPEDGALTNLAWSVDGQPVPDATGQTLQRVNLAPGPHTISLRVHDSAGHLAQAEHQVMVQG